MQVKSPMLIEPRIFRCKHRMHNREILELLGERGGCINRCKPQPCRKPARAHIKCVDTVCDDGRDKAVEYNRCRREGEMECYKYEHACTKYERNTNAYLPRSANILRPATPLFSKCARNEQYADTYPKPDNNRARKYRRHRKPFHKKRCGVKTNDR